MTLIKSYSRSDLFFITGLVLATTLLVAIGITLNDAIKDVRRVSAVRAEARNDAFRLKSLSALLSDAETGQRGFLLTADEKYLAPYAAAVDKIPAVYRELES